jgi:hypothetical protein
LKFQLYQIFKEHKAFEYELLALFQPEQIRHSKAKDIDLKKQQTLKEQMIKIDKSRLGEPDYLANIAKQQQKASIEGIKKSEVGEEA